MLDGLDLFPAQHSTQIVPPEAMTRLCFEITAVGGVLANLADDMRHLQRTEIAEIGEQFGSDQVGSSTMPHKRNPITLENAKSIWKIMLPRLMTVMMDQISEHQRDLTNSASSRTYGEGICYLVSIAERLANVMTKLVVDRNNMDRNLAMQGDLIIAEPLYVILAALGHPDAHEKVRTLTLQAQGEHKSLREVAMLDQDRQSYFEQMTRHQRQILSDPSLYTGIAAKKARSIAERWRKELRIEMAL